MEKRKFGAVIATVTVILSATVVWLGVAFSYGGRSMPEKESDGDTGANGAYNILLLGMDDSVGLCDVIMLVRVDLGAESLTVAQIPRDTYARFTEASYKKLNGAYSSLGGAEKTAEFLSDAMGIDIHHYVCVSLETLGVLVDTVGGVDVDVPSDMYYNDPYQGLYIDIKAGKNHLDGETAQKFVRYRSGYADGDLGRMDAQKLFLAALFKKLSDEFSPLLAAKLAMVVDGVETDMSVNEILSIGSRVTDFSARNMLMLTLPGRDATALKSGASYYVISRESCAEVTESYFGRKNEFDGNESFLNPDYESFREIYGGREEYFPVSVYELISENA